MGGMDGADALSEYEVLRSRIGRRGADRAVAMGWIDPPTNHLGEQQTLPLSPESMPHAAEYQATELNAAELGQVMTPSGIARFMSGLFSDAFPTTVRLLDAGAGRGALTTAFIERWRESQSQGRLESFTYELDERLLGELRANIDTAMDGYDAESNIICGDFIDRASANIRSSSHNIYTHAILNPPYKKLQTKSTHRRSLRSAGLETVNLYSAFVGLAVAMMAPGGEVVAIIPRSFCNGPYYQPFRRFILARAAIRHIHLFEARNRAFKEDGILQENIIIRLDRGVSQTDVKVSTSIDGTFSDYQETLHPFASIVPSDDPDQFIHVPTGDDVDLLKLPAFRYRLNEIGLSVSTGPVVDFRMRGELCAAQEPGTVPLLYPGHFTSKGLEWPKPGFKKPNAIRFTPGTTKWLFPAGYYAVVRRFSAKEERRRVVANVVEPEILQAEMIGFENHLNVLHDGRRPLEEDIARGVAAYLNATVVDRHFRRFNGHTQVNATDLRAMPYPSRSSLIALGQWAKKTPMPSQEEIDQQVANLA